MKAPHPALVMGCLIFAGFGALTVAGGAFVGYTMLLGSSKAVVMNLGNESLSISIDGEFVKEIPAHKLDTLSVPQGDHKITTGQDYSITSDGYSTFVVPVNAAQCFAEVDMSHLYEATGVTSPRVLQVWPGDAAIKVESGVEFFKANLPDSVKPGFKPRLVAAIPCTDLSNEAAEAYILANESSLP